MKIIWMILRGMFLFVIVPILVVIIIAILYFVIGSIKENIMKQNAAKKFPFVTVSDLISSPEQYKNKKIRTTGIWYTAFETSVLQPPDDQKDLSQFTTFENGKIWLDSSSVYKKWGCWESEDESVSVCRVEVSGDFKYTPPQKAGNVNGGVIYYGGQGYGHLGQYEFAICSNVC